MHACAFVWFVCRCVCVCVCVFVCACVCVCVCICVCVCCQVGRVFSSPVGYLAPCGLVGRCVHALEQQHEDYMEGIQQVQSKKKASLAYYA